MWILHLEFHAVCPLWTHWSCLHMFLEIHRKASNIFNNQRLLGVCTIALMLSPSSMLSSSKVFFESNNRPSKEVSLKKRKEKYLQGGQKLVLPWVFADHAFLSITHATPKETVTKPWSRFFYCICCASSPPLRFEIYTKETGSLLAKPRSQDVDS